MIAEVRKQRTDELSQDHEPAPSIALRPRLVQQRSLDTRRRIIAAAIREFAEKGYEGSSTRTIADLAGAPHSAVTYHFQTKEGLRRATVATMLQEQRERLTARLQGLEGVDDTTKLRIVLEDFVRFSATNLDFHIIMSQVARSNSVELDGIVDNILRFTFSLLADLIVKAQARGNFVEGNAYHLLYAFVGTATRIYLLSGEVRQIASLDPFSTDFIEEHVKLCVRLFFRD